jgi:hypothetical protein
MTKELSCQMKVNLKAALNFYPFFQSVRVSHAMFVTDHFQANHTYETTKLYIQENEDFHAR